MKFPFDLDVPSFWLGLISVVVLAFVVFLTEWFGQSLLAPFKPQPVLQTTKKTPWQVLLGSVGSFLIIAGLGLLVAAILVLVLLNAQLAEMSWILVVAAASIIAGVFIRGLAS